VLRLRYLVPALLVLLGSASLANAQIAAIVATIDEIDTKAVKDNQGRVLALGRIKVKTDTDSGVLYVTDKTLIKKNGKKATMDDLQIGEVVQVAYSRQSKAITSLIVTIAPAKKVRDVFVVILARVSEVDAKKNTITVNRREDGAEFVLKVHPKSKLLDDGLPVKVSDIKKRQRVQVKFLKKQKLIAIMNLLDSFE